MKLSYSEIWADTVRMLKANRAIVAALAGVFLFLPALLTAYFIPVPDQVEDFREYLNLMMEHVELNWHWYLLRHLVGLVGTIAILLLLLGVRGGTVGALIATAFMILPFYFVAAVISNLIISVGFILLFVPGLYLFGRLVMTGPVVVAEDQRNPITAISRSWALTRGNGWAVLGLVLLVAIAGTILAAVVGMLFGILFILVAGQDLGGLLVKILEALLNAALAALIIALTAAIYRRLSGKGSAAD